MSDMPQIYVHIGLPKTATTTLQMQRFTSPRVGISGNLHTALAEPDPTFKLLEAYVQRGEDRCRWCKRPWRVDWNGKASP